MTPYAHATLSGNEADFDLRRLPLALAAAGGLVAAVAGATYGVDAYLAHRATVAAETLPVLTQEVAVTHAVRAQGVIDGLQTTGVVLDQEIFDRLGEIIESDTRAEAEALTDIRLDAMEEALQGQWSPERLEGYISRIEAISPRASELIGTAETDLIMSGIDPDKARLEARSTAFLALSGDGDDISRRLKALSEAGEKDPETQHATTRMAGLLSDLHGEMRELETTAGLHDQAIRGLALDRALDELEALDARQDVEQPQAGVPMGPEQ